MNVKCLWITAITAAIALAALVVNRLDNQSLALLTGAVCGIVAGVPLSFAIFWVTMRHQLTSTSTAFASPPPARAPQQPVIIVQSAPPPPHAPWQQSYPPLEPYTRPARDFNIIGEDEEDDDGSS